MSRKFLLVVLLISAVGLGCGYCSEDLCALGGSFADDPTSPGITAEFALPTHPQASLNAVAQLAAVLPTPPQLEPLSGLDGAAETVAAPPPSIPVPIRC